MLNLWTSYIKKKEDLYEEGGQVEYQQLMDWALNKLKTRKESEQWWCQKTTEEETIIALQAQVKSLITNQKKSDTGGNKSAGGNKDRKKTNKKGKGNGKFKREDKPAWMPTPPKDGEKQSKTVEGKEYHWCQHQQASWTRHQPSECKGKEGF